MEMHSSRGKRKGPLKSPPWGIGKSHPFYIGPDSPVINRGAGKDYTGSDDISKSRVQDENLLCQCCEVGEEEEAGLKGNFGVQPGGKVSASLKKSSRDKTQDAAVFELDSVLSVVSVEQQQEVEISQIGGENDRDFSLSRDGLVEEAGLPRTSTPNKCSAGGGARRQWLPASFTIQDVPAKQSPVSQQLLRECRQVENHRSGRQPSLEYTRQVQEANRVCQVPLQNLREFRSCLGSSRDGQFPLSPLGLNSKECGESPTGQFRYVDFADTIDGGRWPEEYGGRAKYLYQYNAENTGLTELAEPNSRRPRGSTGIDLIDSTSSSSQSLRLRRGEDSDEVGLQLKLEPMSGYREAESGHVEQRPPGRMVRYGERQVSRPAGYNNHQPRAQVRAGNRISSPLHAAANNQAVRNASSGSSVENGPETPTRVLSYQNMASPTTTFNSSSRPYLRRAPRMYSPQPLNPTYGIFAVATGMPHRQDVPQEMGADNVFMGRTKSPVQRNQHGPKTGPKTGPKPGPKPSLRRGPRGNANFQTHRSPNRSLSPSSSSPLLYNQLPNVQDPRFSISNMSDGWMEDLYSERSTKTESGWHGSVAPPAGEQVSAATAAAQQGEPRGLSELYSEHLDEDTDISTLESINSQLQLYLEKKVSTQGLDLFSKDHAHSVWSVLCNESVT